MRLYLCGVAVTGEPEPGDEVSRKLWPVDIRVGRQVGIEVADGTVHFAEQLYSHQTFTLTAQSRRHIGEFLAESRRTCRLSVGA